MFPSSLNVLICCLICCCFWWPQPTEQISAATWMRAFELGQRLTRPPLTFWVRVYYPFPVEVINKKYVPVSVPTPVYVTKPPSYPSPPKSEPKQYSGSSSTTFNTYALPPQPLTSASAASYQTLKPLLPNMPFPPSSEGPNAPPSSIPPQSIIDPSPPPSAAGNLPTFLPNPLALQPRYYFPLGVERRSN